MKTCACVVLCAVALLGGCSGNGQAQRAEQTPEKGTVAYDRGVFTQLLNDHQKVRRSWREIDGGIESMTESDDPAVAALIVEHVEAMKDRVETGRRIRQWDPLYVAVFDAGGRIRLDVERTGKGVKVRETSGDPAVAALIRQHAGVVSGFAARGTEESAIEHPVGK